jgi:hypothetical protein
MLAYTKLPLVVDGKVAWRKIRLLDWRRNQAKNAENVALHFRKMLPYSARNGASDVALRARGEIIESELLVRGFPR